MTKDGVSIAFELILDELGSVIQDLNNDGSQALQSGKYDVAQDLIETGRRLLKFQEKVQALQNDWTNSFDENAHGRVQNDLLAGHIAFQTHESPTVLEVYMGYGGTKAKGKYRNNKIVLLEGSTIKQDIYPSLEPSFVEMREEMKRKGKLIGGRTSGYYILQEDTPFQSASGAAKFVAGCSVNGLREWKIEGTQTTLGEWLRKKERH